MNGIIYKAADSITKEEILQACEYRDGSGDYYDVYTYDELMSNIRCYGITDYDGNGYMMLSNNIVDNSELLIYNESVYIKDKFFIPLDTLHDIFGKDLEFVWYNK